MGIFVYALVLSLLGFASSLDARQGYVSQEASQRGTLQERLQKLLPQQRRDLVKVVPQIAAGDKAGFKQSLATMLHDGADGGKARIKRCLDGLAVAGFKAIEIQTWLESSTAPVPQSIFHKDKATKEVKKLAISQERAAAFVQPDPTVGALASFAAEQQKKQKDHDNAQNDWDAIKELEQKGPDLQQPEPEQAAEAVEQKSTKDEEMQKKYQAAVKLAAEKPQKQALEKAAAEEAQKQKKKKAALRHELAKRLDKGVQALKRVGALEKQETALKSSVSSEEERIKGLKERLEKETQATEHMQEENAKLEAEVAQEDKRSLSVEARLDALEKRQRDMAQVNTEEKLQSLEEDYGKLRTGLAGAAKRIINLEAAAVAGLGKKSVFSASAAFSQPAAVNLVAAAVPAESKKSVSAASAAVSQPAAVNLVAAAKAGESRPSVSASSAAGSRLASVNRVAAAQAGQSRKSVSAASSAVMVRAALTEESKKSDSAAASQDQPAAVSQRHPEVNKAQAEVNKVQSEVNEVQPEVKKVELEVKKIEPEVKKVHHEVDKVEPEVRKVHHEVRTDHSSGVLALSSVRRSPTRVIRHSKKPHQSAY